VAVEAGVVAVCAVRTGVASSLLQPHQHVQLQAHTDQSLAGVHFETNYCLSGNIQDNGANSTMEVNFSSLQTCVKSGEGYVAFAQSSSNEDFVKIEMSQEEYKKLLLALTSGSPSLPDGSPSLLLAAADVFLVGVAGPALVEVGAGAWLS
jgi:hypothetical protein